MEKRFTIGVIIGNANSPHTKTLMRGICDAAEKRDVNIIFFLGVHMAHYYQEYFGDKMENCYDFQYNVVYDYANLADVDGLIIAYGSLCIFLEDKNKQHFLDRFKGIPYVLVEDRDERGMGSSIISDNYHGMYQIVEHLVTVHHYKKFLFLSGPDDNTDAEERERAFYDVLAKYSIPFEAGRRGAGDYLQCCNKEIARLLDTYPDADALVCANDVMAETAYQECAKRNIEVGKDLAITGYDDWDLAETMTPPLTTVLQNELDMGDVCVKNIIDLCKGKKPVATMVPAEPKIRASCGCTMRESFHFPKADWIEEATKENYIRQVVECFCERIMLSQVSAEREQEVRDYIYKIIKMNCGLLQDPNTYRIKKKELRHSVNEMLTSACGEYISITALQEGVNAYIAHLSAIEETNERTHLLMELEGVLLQCIESSIVKRGEEKEGRYEQDTMFIPLISRDMLNNMGDETAFFRAPMNTLSVLHAKSAYLYITDKPIYHAYGEKWNCPEKLYLASYFENGEIVSYKPDERPVVTMENGMTTSFISDRRRILTGFNLFQGIYQYGFFIVEIEPCDMLLMHLVSMQISSSLNFYYMYQRQMQMQKQLEELVEEVNEKNKILGFISEYDEMTGVLNRRGFMEKAMDFILRGDNGSGILLIADLDHLKEINDCYGHVAGDFAIQSAAYLLKETLGKDTLIARLGGDEFVALLPYKTGLSGDIYIRRLREISTEFNESSGKEFYVELSAGYTIFKCGEDVDFKSILSSSDKMLYEAKQMRRTSIKKMQ